MISYKEACNQVGLNDDHTPLAAKYVYYGYKNGECKSFETRDEAKEFGIAVERVQTNKEECDLYWAKRDALAMQALDIWYNTLREEYKHLSDNIFNLCYDQAYDRGHAYGYDEVASYMTGIVDFAERIIEASKNG